MRISQKISLLIGFLLLTLAATTLIGLTQLSRMGQELNAVARRDILLIQTSAVISDTQYEKAIRFERILQAAEELAFDQPKAARRKYLIDHIHYTKKAFDHFSRQGADAILKGKELIAGSSGRREERRIGGLLLQVEKAHINYDELVTKIYDMIREGGYELSLEDLDRIHQRESRVSVELKNILAQINVSVQESLAHSESQQELARFILWVSLLVSLFVGVLVTIMIIKNITHPLKQLSLAADEIARGNYRIHLDHPSRDEIGEVSRAFNTMANEVADVTEKLRVKSEMLSQNLDITRRQKRELQKVNHELDNFVHTVSHDIKTPLTGILGYCAYLEKHYAGQMDQKGKDCLTGIHKGAKRLNALIQDLLTLTKISRVQNPYEDVDFSELVRSVLDRLEYRVKQLSVGVKIETGFPHLICDRIKIEEVLYNLINNGIKFSSKNESSAPEVAVGYHDRGAFGEFYVRDNGIGIDPEDHDKVFGIFQRLPSASEFEGTGAGLSIVKAIVEGHGGRVWLESHAGQGATFYFTVPKNLRRGDATV